MKKVEETRKEEAISKYEADFTLFACGCFSSGWLYHKISLHALGPQCHIHSGKYEPRGSFLGKQKSQNLFFYLNLKI